MVVTRNLPNPVLEYRHRYTSISRWSRSEFERISVLRGKELALPGAFVLPAVLAADFQRRGDSRYDFVPISRLPLTENLDRRVPRRVLPVQHPAPFAFKAIRHPDRFAERSRQMRYRCIDADNQIQLLYQCGGIQKIVAFVHPLKNIPTRFSELVHRFTFLKAHKTHAANPEQWRKLLQSNIPQCFFGIAVFACPDQFQRSGSLRAVDSSVIRVTRSYVQDSTNLRG